MVSVRLKCVQLRRDTNREREKRRVSNRYMNKNNEKSSLLVVTPSSLQVTLAVHTNTTLAKYFVHLLSKFLVKFESDFNSQHTMENPGKVDKNVHWHSSLSKLMFQSEINKHNLIFTSQSQQKLHSWQLRKVTAQYWVHKLRGHKCKTPQNQELRKIWNDYDYGKTVMLINGEAEQ